MRGSRAWHVGLSGTRSGLHAHRAPAASMPRRPIRRKRDVVRRDAHDRHVVPDFVERSPDLLVVERRGVEVPSHLLVQTLPDRTPPRRALTAEVVETAVAHVHVGEELGAAAGARPQLVVRNRLARGVGASPRVVSRTGRARRRAPCRSARRIRPAGQMSACVIPSSRAGIFAAITCGAAAPAIEPLLHLAPTSQVFGQYRFEPRHRWEWRHFTHGPPRRFEAWRRFGARRRSGCNDASGSPQQVGDGEPLPLERPRERAAQALERGNRAARREEPAARHAPARQQHPAPPVHKGDVDADAHAKRVHGATSLEQDGRGARSSSPRAQQAHQPLAPRAQHTKPDACHAPTARDANGHAGRSGA